MRITSAVSRLKRRRRMPVNQSMSPALSRPSPRLVVSWGGAAVACPAVSCFRSFLYYSGWLRN